MSTFVTKAKIVESWAGSPVAGSYIVDQAVNVSAPADVPTYLDANGATAAVRGMREWNFSIDGLIGTPLVCNAPTLTFSGGGITNLIGWDISVSVTAVESTHFGQADTSSYWKSYLPGVLSWTGNLFYRADNDDPGVLPANQVASACTLGIDGSNTLSGTIITSGLTENVRIGEIPALQMPFQGSGTLTAAGTNNIVAAGAVAAMDPGAVVLKYGEVGATDVTRTGSAFFTGLNLSCQIGSMVTYGIQAQGTGALAVSDPEA